jgi:hypothetical protein
MVVLVAVAKKVVEPPPGVDFYGVGWNVAGILFTVVIGFTIYKLTRDAMARRR